MGTKTGITAERAVFNRLITSGVKGDSLLSGMVYLKSRPKDSKLEDIVVRVLTMGADQVQEGVVNVNIHAPNLLLANDSTQPDNLRLEFITDKVVAVLSDYTGFDYKFDVKIPGVPYRDDGLDWFVNVQVEFWSLRRKN